MPADAMHVNPANVFEIPMPESIGETTVVDNDLVAHIPIPPKESAPPPASLPIGPPADEPLVKESSKSPSVAAADASPLSIKPSAQGIENAKRRLRAFSIQKKQTTLLGSKPPAVSKTGQGSNAVVIGKLSGGIPKIAVVHEDPAKPAKPPKRPKPKKPDKGPASYYRNSISEIEELKRNMELVELGVPLGLIETTNKSLPTRAMPPIKKFIELCRKCARWGYGRSPCGYLCSHARRRKARSRSREYTSRRRDNQKVEAFLEKVNKARQVGKVVNFKFEDELLLPKKKEKHKHNDDFRSKDRSDYSSHRRRHTSTASESFESKDHKEHKEADVNLEDYVVCDSWSLDTEPKEEENHQISNINVDSKVSESKPAENIDSHSKKTSHSSKDRSKSSTKVDQSKRGSEKTKLNEVKNIEKKPVENTERHVKKSVQISENKNAALPPVQDDRSKKVEKSKTVVESSIYDDGELNVVKKVSSPLVQKPKNVEVPSNSLHDFAHTDSEKLSTKHIQPIVELDNSKDKITQLVSSENVTICPTAAGRDSQTPEYTNTVQEDLESSMDRMNVSFGEMSASKEKSWALIKNLPLGSVWSSLLKLCQPLMFRHDKTKCTKQTKAQPTLDYSESPKRCPCVKNRGAAYEELEQIHSENVQKLYSMRTIQSDKEWTSQDWYPSLPYALSDTLSIELATNWESDDSNQMIQIAADVLQDSNENGTNSLDREYELFMESVWPEVTEEDIDKTTGEDVEKETQSMVLEGQDMPAERKKEKKTKEKDGKKGKGVEKKAGNNDEQEQHVMEKLDAKSESKKKKHVKKKMALKAKKAEKAKKRKRRRSSSSTSESDSDTSDSSNSSTSTEDSSSEVSSDSDSSSSESESESLSDEAKSKKKSGKKKARMALKMKVLKKKKLERQRKLKRLKEKQRKRKMRKLKEKLEAQADYETDVIKKDKHKKKEEAKQKKKEKRKLERAKRKEMKKKKQKEYSSSSSTSSGTDSSDTEEETSKHKKKSRNKKKKVSLSKKTSKKRNKKERKARQNVRDSEELDDSDDDEMFSMDVLQNIKMEHVSDEDMVSGKKAVEMESDFSPRRKNRQSVQEIISVTELHSDFVGNNYSEVSVKVESEITPKTNLQTKDKCESLPAAEVSKITEQEVQQVKDVPKSGLVTVDTEKLQVASLVVETVEPVNYIEDSQSQSSIMFSEPAGALDGTVHSQDSVISHSVPMIPQQQILISDEANLSQASSQESIYSISDQTCLERATRAMLPQYDLHASRTSSDFSHNSTAQMGPGVSVRPGTTYSDNLFQDIRPTREHSQNAFLDMRPDSMSSDKTFYRTKATHRVSQETFQGVHVPTQEDAFQEVRTASQNVYQVPSLARPASSLSQNSSQDSAYSFRGFGTETTDAELYGNVMGRTDPNLYAEFQDDDAQMYQGDVVDQDIPLPTVHHIETVVSSSGSRGEIKCDWRPGQETNVPSSAGRGRPSRWGMQSRPEDSETGGQPVYRIPSILDAKLDMETQQVYKIETISSGNRQAVSCQGYESMPSPNAYDAAYADMYGAADHMQYGDCFAEPPSAESSPPLAKPAAPVLSLDDRINMVLRNTPGLEKPKVEEEPVGVAETLPDKGILVNPKVESVDLKMVRAAKRVCFADGYHPGQDSDVEEPPTKRTKRTRRRYGCAYPCPASHPDHEPLWDALPPPPPPPGSPPPGAPPPLARAPPAAAASFLRGARLPPAPKEDLSDIKLPPVLGADTITRLPKVPSHPNS